MSRAEKLVGVGALAVIVFAFWSSVADAAPRPRGGPSGLEVTFVDNFRGHWLNRDKWFRNHTGHRTHYGPQGNTAFKPSQIRVHNGRADLRLSPRDYQGQAYTGSRIDTLGRFEFRYGWVEARMRLPKRKRDWAGFWTNGRSWPSTGEFDIVETLGDTRNPRAIIHTDGQGGGRIGEAWFPHASTTWHTYAMRWTRRGVAMIYDGKVIGRWRGHIAAHHHVILMLQGPLYGDTYRNDRLMVDYVRVWQNRGRS
jgi:beta-glucanase (GH16 family)